MATEREITFYMKEALKQARDAALMNEVPIGAVIVHDGQIIGRGHNMRERYQDVTYHAEILVINEANQALRSWRLENCELYVTLEPCIMCSGAIINARIPRVYYGAADPKAGAVHSLYQLMNDQRLNHQVEVHAGIMEAPCQQLLKDFFRAIRRRKKILKQKPNR